MERGFAAAGSAPAVADTPAEVLARATRAGLVRPEPAETLTGLFRRARYSTYPMTSADSLLAADALTEMRSDLGQSADQSVSHRGVNREPPQAGRRRRRDRDRDRGRARGRLRRGGRHRPDRRGGPGHPGRPDRGARGGPGGETTLRSAEKATAGSGAAGRPAADFPAYASIASDVEWARMSQRHYEHALRPRLARLAAALGKSGAIDITGPADPDGPGPDLATLERIVTHLEAP